MSIEAMKQMVEALEGFYEYGYDRLECYEHITAIKQAIAEAEKQEPVAFVVDRFQGQNTGSTMPEPQVIWIGRMEIGDKLYTTPQPKQEQGEPVAEVDSTISGHINWLCTFFPKQGTKLYTTPQQRTWIGLTDEDIDDLVKNTQWHELIKATEVKLKEKNT